ncbi:EPIDERMAL PATTERNING FACTOR-like protein 4 [Mercurialis annua]|uniref:EPIDERMAL PATTERNING FACTOR-like protein 4 n=1 Tax=Mercurialis annua TaxID=3986 RepID=UPI0021603232|nr:EPIDERMAL PATTERNING FACTOR-like protein 4 [Mercurialis annua]
MASSMRDSRKLNFAMILMFCLLSVLFVRHDAMAEEAPGPATSPTSGPTTGTMTGSAKSSTTGSGPPNCVGKCNGCTPCNSVLSVVPPAPGYDQAPEYYPVIWKCRCGDNNYMP